MTKKIKRRSFLQSTAAVGGAAAVGFHTSTEKQAQAASAQDKVVVAVMGMSRGKSLATGFAKLKNVEVKYCCDIDTGRADSGANAVAAQKVARPKAIQDYRQILDDKGVDALVCAAPNHWHAPATIFACQAGKHVYVEKPCSHNAQEGEMMVKAARQHKRAVQMGTQRRSGKGTQAAIKKLHEGAIGRIYLVRAYYNSARGSIGKGKPAKVPNHINYDLWQGPAPRRPYIDNLVHYNWHWRWHWGNGELGNNGIHTLDLCRWGLNVEFPSKVTSSGQRYCFDDDQETPDTHQVAFEFGDKGSITWQGLSCNRHGGEDFVIFYGTGGAMELDSNGGHKIYDAKNSLVANEKGFSRGDQEHLDNFVAAIRNDKPLDLNSEIEIGHRSTLLCHLGNIAQRTGRTLHCNTENGHILNDPDAMKLWGREYDEKFEPKV